MILDHKNGVSGDYRLENLRFLCPNCDAQLPTRGGANKGRNIQSAGGFGIKRDDGKYDYEMATRRGAFVVTSGIARGRKR